MSGCKPRDRHVVDLNVQTLLSLEIGVRLCEMLSAVVEAERRDILVLINGRVTISLSASEQSCCLDERFASEQTCCLNAADDRPVPGPRLDSRMLFLFRSDDGVSVLRLFLHFAMIHDVIVDRTKELYCQQMDWNESEMDRSKRFMKILASDKRGASPLFLILDSSIY